MKKILLMLLTGLLLSAAACAQRGLNCYPVFKGKMVPERQMVVTEVRGGGLNTYTLDYYRGVRFQVDTTYARKVAALVEADAAQAASAETERVRGFLTYALIEPGSTGKTNRYLCYQARPVGSAWIITILYLEGSATLEDLRSMFDKQKDDEK